MRNFVLTALLGLWALMALPAMAQDADDGATDGEEEVVSETFPYPMEGRHRVDYCLYDSIDCGIGAAHRFCTRKGYFSAESFREELSVLVTVRLGDRSICRGRECIGFEEIVCTGEGQDVFQREGYERPARPSWDDGSSETPSQTTE